MVRLGIWKADYSGKRWSKV